ncbi:MAG: sodium-translocating pyrophosphatase, partial [Opitutaceae bacterium]
MRFHKLRQCLAAGLFVLPALALHASEADIKIPDLGPVSFFDHRLSGIAVLLAGIVVCGIGVLFGVIQYVQTRNLPVHASMGNVSHVIWETCKTYLL